LHGQGFGFGSPIMSTALDRRDRWLCALEVSLVALLLAGQIWLVWEWLPIAEAAQRVVRVSMVVLLVAVLVWSFVRVRDSRSELGLTIANMRVGWWPVVAFTIGALVTLGVTTVLLPNVTFGELNFDWLLTYSHGMLGQQLALQWFLNNRVYHMLGSTDEPRRTAATVIICVIVFTLLHAPNPGLMLSVLPASAFWCWHFRRYRNMPALLVSHFILGGAAMVLLGDGPLLRLRVGPSAWRMLMGET
jgi:hypothetical protein